MPKVSIALPVYNGERYLRTAIECCLDQSFRDLELLIFDNASTDQTGEISKEYAAKDPRVVYRRNEKNIGAAPNFNISVEPAVGEYFKWHSHDDSMEPTYIERCVDILDRHPDVVLAHSVTRLIDENDEELHFDERHQRYVDSRGRGRMGGGRKGRCSQDGAFDRWLEVQRTFIRNFDVFGLIRLDPLRKTALHGSVYGSDRNLLAELALYGKFHEIDEPLFLKREHYEHSLAIPSAEDRAIWTDPSSKAKYFPHLQLWRQDLGAVLRAPLSLRDKMRCVGVMARLVGFKTILNPSNWRRTFKDQATLQTLDR